MHAINYPAAFGPSRFSSGAAKRFVCCFAALFLYGCSAPLPVLAPDSPPTQNQQNQQPPAIAVNSAPRAELVSAPLPDDQTAPPVEEENTVFFPSRSAAVADTEKEKLRQHADRLKSSRKETVLLEGHTDDQGSRNYNLAITEERLMAVEKLLRGYGVSARQIRRNRSARVRDSVHCTTAACRQQMRSVELHYSP